MELCLNLVTFLLFFACGKLVFCAARFGSAMGYGILNAGKFYFTYLNVMFVNFIPFISKWSTNATCYVYN